jgi:hypothetical protein
MDWKKELDKKFEQLNQKEEQNVQHRSGSRSISGNSAGRSGGIYLSECNRKTQVTTNDERSKKMISAAGALKDYEDIVKEDTDASAKLVKIMRIVIKLLLSIRTNQTGGLKSETIKRIEVKTV